MTTVNAPTAFDIRLESVPSVSTRAQSVRTAYDVQAPTITEHISGAIDLPDQWSIGVITGHSGTGKSSLAKSLWPDSYVKSFDWTAQSVIDDFPQSIPDALLFQTLFRVGFGSIPSWLKPYHVLSQGEQMRVNLARALLSDKSLVVFDEFTSTVDRQVACFASVSVRKAIAESGKRFVAVSCHSDFIEWLQPDWVFNTDSMTTTVKKKAQPEASSICQSPCTNASVAYGPSLGDITISITT